MDRQTLRRIGWVGASLGLTSVLVGCQDIQSDVGATEATGGGSVQAGYIEEANGLNAVNGLNGANGLNAVNGLSAANGLNTANGLGSANGLNSVNGLNGANGFNTANGWISNNGLNSVNGLNVANGLNSVNGLSSANGLMTSDAGRQTVSYLVKCALAAGDTLVKQDQNGNNFTFKGGIGLAPEYKTGGCTKGCTEALSSCLMAHVNTTGVHIPLWMTSPLSPIGWGQSPSYPTQEGTFFGQIMLTNTASNLDAYFCNGPDVTSDVVPGRLGSSANAASAPYANAYPADGGQCNKSGHCSMQSSGDGAVSCVGNGITWDKPITVWRGKTFQAENATLNGASQISDSHNSNGKRVGNIGPSATVKFTSVPAAQAGSNNLVIYYANGDGGSGIRYFNIKVNGGSAQSKGFKIVKSGDWSAIGQATITLTGFNAGTSNTVEFLGDGQNAAPDLDWIEIIGSNANYCDQSRWIVTASNSTNQDPPSNAIDKYDTSRWTNGRNQDGTDWFVVDFGGLVTMSNLTLTNTGYDPHDYPKTVELYASQDGTTFESTKFASAAGTDDQTIVTFAPKTMRALKLKEVGSRSTWWSIHEFDSDCTVATTSAQAAVATNACAIGNTVAFKSMSAGKYISARSADNNNIDALKDTVAGDAEKFVIVDAGGGFVALKALMNNQYVAVEGGVSNQPLRARSTTIGGWEKFKIENLQTTGHVAIKANSPSLYVQANMGTSNDVLQANASAVGGWEDFTCEKQ